MPPTHKKKILNYSEDQMLSAVKDVKNGLPVATAAKKNGVPRITLLYKVKGKTPMKRQMGRDSYLTSNEENILGEWIINMARVGFPIGKTQLLDSVQHIMTALKRNNPFKNNRPGKSWYKSFLARNKNICLRTPQNLTVSRASVTKAQLNKWFSEVQEYLKAEKYDGILGNSNRVFNADEAAFFLCPKGDKVLAKKGEKNIYQNVNSDEKECITVLMTGNAAGVLAPPMVVFRYERIPRDLVLSVPSSWGIGKSESGWMTGETFFEYVTNVFHPWLAEQNIERSIILFRLTQVALNFRHL